MTTERLRLFTHRSVRMMIDATGTLLIAFTRGERKMSRVVMKEDRTPSMRADMNERIIPRRTLERVNATAVQKDDVGRRAHRDRSVLRGEGRKISSPTTAERTDQTAIHTMTAAA